MSFGWLGGLFDFDGDGHVDENDTFFASLFSDRYSRNTGFDSLTFDYDEEDDEESDDYDPFGAQDYANAREFYEDNSGDFSDYEKAEDYYEDWG